jgi:hypothetical protein
VRELVRMCPELVEGRTNSEEMSLSKDPDGNPLQPHAVRTFPRERFPPGGQVRAVVAASEVASGCRITTPPATGPTSLFNHRATGLSVPRTGARSESADAP